MNISVISTKGGTGKSTLVALLAYSKVLQSAFESICIVELDPQGTLAKWWKKRKKSGFDLGKVRLVSIYGTDRDAIEPAVNGLIQAHDLLLFDPPGESESKIHTQFAHAIADMTLIQMRTTTKDEDAFDNLDTIIRQYRKLKKSNEVYIVPAFTHPNSKPDGFVDYFESWLPEYVRCLPVAFPNRSEFENYDRGGTNLIESINEITNTKERIKALKSVNEIESIAEIIIKQWQNLQKAS